jgi:hypothetical protein
LTEKTATPNTSITEYEPIAAALAGIEQFRGLVVDVSTPAKLRDAKQVLRVVAEPRIALEKARQKLKADVLERGRLIDGEAKRIGALFAAIEDPIKAQIDAEELRIEAEREAAIKAEQDRLAREEAERKAAEERRLAEERAKLEAEKRQLDEARAKQEAELRAQREKAEAEDRERRRALQEEEDRRAAARRAEEEKLAAERRALEDAQRKQREEQEAREREERRKVEEAQAAERARQRAEQEKREAAEREEKRKASELLDARVILDNFVERFGTVKEFAGVVRAIKACRRQKTAVAA